MGWLKEKSDLVSLEAAQTERYDCVPWGGSNSKVKSFPMRQHKYSSNGNMNTFFTGQIKNEGKTVSHWAAKKIGMPFPMIWLKIER